MDSVFEFDAAKSAANKAKHGIDFKAAQALWRDGNLLVVPTRFVSEMRWIAIGVIEGKHWSAVFTTREHAIRLISVRRARDYEIENYLRGGV